MWLSFFFLQFSEVLDQLRALLDWIEEQEVSSSWNKSIRLKCETTISIVVQTVTQVPWRTLSSFDFTLNDFLCFYLVFFLHFFSSFFCSFLAIVIHPLFTFALSPNIRFSQSPLFNGARSRRATTTLLNHKHKEVPILLLEPFPSLLYPLNAVSRFLFFTPPFLFCMLVQLGYWLEEFHFLLIYMIIGTLL